MGTERLLLRKGRKGKSEEPRDDPSDREPRTGAQARTSARPGPAPLHRVRTGLAMRSERGEGARPGARFLAIQCHFLCRPFFSHLCSLIFTLFLKEDGFRISELNLCFDFCSTYRRKYSTIHSFIPDLLSTYYAPLSLTTKKTTDASGSTEIFGFLKQW